MATPGPKQSVFPGDRFLMKENGWLTITSYISCRQVGVKFEETGYETFTELVVIRRGTVRDYLKPSVYGVGFLGVGRHAAYTANKPSWIYTRWINMLERCYSDEWQAEKPAYIGCTVDVWWHNFQNFADWALRQVGVNVKGFQLDKDILVHGNRFYSQDTCCFVPNDLNSMFISGRARRGECVIGVHKRKSSGKYFASCSTTYTTQSRVGIFGTEEEAFQEYKKHKELYIKRKATKWQSQIDPRAYEALMNYEVLITD